MEKTKWTEMKSNKGNDRISKRENKLVKQFKVKTMVYDRSYFKKSSVTTTRKYGTTETTAACIPSQGYVVKRDMILKTDISSCVDYVEDNKSQHDSFDVGDGTGRDITSATLDEELILPVSNDSTGSSIPCWIPPEFKFLRASNFSETFEPEYESFDANGQIPCGMNDLESIIVDEDMAVLDNGQLQIMYQKDKGLNDIYQQLTFSPTEYCIDRVSLSENFTFTDKKKNRRSVAATVNTNGMTTNGTVGVAKETDDAVNTMAAIFMYSYVALVCRLCSKITCVPKCCGKSFVLEYRKNRESITGCRKLQNNVKAAINLKAANGTELNRQDYYFTGMKPPDCGSRSWYMLNKTGPDAIGYGLLPDGRMHVDNGVVPIERDEYCVDAVNVVQPAGNATPARPPSVYSDVLVVCRVNIASNITGGSLEFREILYGAYFVVGALFLAATLLIYVVLPELRVTVHSGNLIAHTACLFVSYATLAATTLVRDVFNYYACVVAGFVIQFSFLAAFFWLNVMCADIAWTFSGFRLLLYSNKIENEKKKYIIYSAYAWGCSIGISLLTALAEFTKLFGDRKYKPTFGQKDCWFSNKLSVGVFFYLPIGLLLLTNFILFLFTAFRIVFIRRDTSKVLNRQTNQNNMRLSLYLKLFCLMGVTFVFEVISWAVTAPPYYWYVTDAVNSLRGVFVFFIFCWKRSVLNLLLARTPKSTRDRFVQAFGIRVTHRYPSFSSGGQLNTHFSGSGTTASMRTLGSMVSTHNVLGGSGSGGGSSTTSFQLSQFGSNTSMVALRKLSSPRW
ncbi:Methuselah ectodomain, domain 2,Methuselah, N-terminal domain,GPCR, family 2-like,GPCR, family 2 [Cinara cedri]|uniref:Methuselah ectodomain, domain 2,Methuselah, N-terminal domain,GPCR, family 2-like,GPCR, family 2 n=1 Tax=Cinara cedri TaxID=506608 RepID=A0A5E4M830_9HEMI|nr:Methuselah ectodomain, domain 2,Methuselah, N-terminal domain,GPCR, family 2-like,GPCR, family 2 [Cinara cedri]